MSYVTAETRLFRSLFSRTAGQALSSVASHSLANCTTEACAQVRKCFQNDMYYYYYYHRRRRPFKHVHLIV